MIYGESGLPEQDGRQDDMDREQQAVDREGRRDGEDQTEPVGYEEESLTEQDPSLVEAQAKAEEYYQRVLRLQADFDNFRRRTRQDKEDWFRMAGEGFAQALLPVLDNFDLALANPGSELDHFLTGVRMIRRQLEEALGAQGLELMVSVGQPFDPNRHEAISQVVTAEQPEDTVVEEMRRGYLFKGRVLRPAMVKVAKSESDVGGNAQQ